MIGHAVGRPVSTLIGAVTLVVLGTFSLLRLPVSLLPQLERPRLEISIPAEGQAREEVIDRLTRPVERRLAALAGVTSVRTWTGDGFLRVRVESEWQTDADRLRIEAERLLAGLDDAAVASITIELATGDAEPIVEVAVLGGASGSTRTAFARKLLVPELARLDGAGRIETVGLTPLHAVVRPRAAALAARGLTPADLVGRLRSMGLALPAGRALAGATVRPLLVREDVASLDDLRALRVDQSFLGDVASVSLEEVEDGTFFRLDGKEGVLVRVFRAPEANAVALARGVRERVAELAGRTGSGPRPQVVSDRSGEVVAALEELGLAALIGIVLGAAVLRILLGRWRPTLAMMVVVPASLLTSFAGFHLAGASLDVVSLAGLALAAGMLVDSAIVVLESIETARAAGDPSPAVTGTKEVALPVIASFLTSAVVFLPLIYLEGLARAFFGVQAFAIVVSQAASLLFSLTVTPVLSGNAPAKKDLGRSPGRRAYLGLLDAALARPRLTVLAGIATALVAVLALAVLPSELVPDAASKELMVRYRLSPDLSPEAARILGEQVVNVGAGMATQFLEDERREETGRVVLSFADPEEAKRARKAVAAALSRLPDVEAWVEPRTSAFVEPIERAGRRLEIVAPPALAAQVRERLAGTGLRE
ncbi:MAG TPA: efflux RND transporter permease subunit, partial [Thermoanaerobaculia bacterium]|nr:efflux RND transporter permease subunit [Thermoanaerobaculia bacterium]